MIPVSLPANKTYAFRRVYLARVKEDPRLGVIQIEEGNSAAWTGGQQISRYGTYEEDAPDAGGRLFRVIKPGGQEFYWVRLAPGETSCDCTGFLQHGHCKHAEALTALASRGQLKPVLGDSAGVRTG